MTYWNYECSLKKNRVSSKENKNTNWEVIFATHTIHKRLVSNLHKELQINKEKNLKEKQAKKRLNRDFKKEGTQMANNKNRYLNSIIREIANKKHNEITSQMDIFKFGKW